MQIDSHPAACAAQRTHGDQQQAQGAHVPESTLPVLHHLCIHLSVSIRGTMGHGWSRSPGVGTSVHNDVHKTIASVSSVLCNENSQNFLVTLLFYSKYSYRFWPVLVPEDPYWARNYSYSAADVTAGLSLVGRSKTQTLTSLLTNNRWLITSLTNKIKRAFQWQLFIKIIVCKCYISSPTRLKSTGLKSSYKTRRLYIQLITSKKQTNKKKKNIHSQCFLNV